MFAHLFSSRTKHTYSAGKSAQPPFPPLPVLILGLKFLCKSPQNECTFWILNWMFSYFTLWHTQLFSKRHLIWSDIQSTENSRPIFVASPVIFRFFTVWGRRALFFDVNLFPPSKRGPSAAWGCCGSQAGTQWAPPSHQGQSQQYSGLKTTQNSESFPEWYPCQQ